PAPATAGAAGAATVTARDAFGNVATTYLGSVTFSSSDAQAVLPATTAFTSADAGVRSFLATFKTVGSQSVTAADTTNAAISGSQQGITVVPGGAASLIVSGVSSPIPTGSAGSVTVEVRDGYGNRATNYLGTIAFTSSDLRAVLPANYAFQSTDVGLHTFSG